MFESIRCCLLVSKINKLRVKCTIVLSLALGVSAAFIADKAFAGYNYYPENAVRLESSTPVSGDNFGYAVDVDGNTMVVGIPYADIGVNDNQGAAYVYQRSAAGSTNWVFVTELTASDGAEKEQFGADVVVQGDTIVVGAHKDDTGTMLQHGSAYVYYRNQGGADNWGEIKKILHPNSVAGDEFGKRVALDGDRLVIAATLDTVSGAVKQGSVQVYGRNQGGADNWGWVTELLAPDGAANSRFGGSVAVCGDLVSVGAHFHTVGSNVEQGSAYIFGRNQGGVDAWGCITNLVASNGDSGDRFGRSIAMDENDVVVGAHTAEVDGVADQGAVYVYHDDGTGTNWNETSIITAPDGNGDEFGYDCDIWSNRLAVGAALRVYGSRGKTGSACLYDIESDGSAYPVTELVSPWSVVGDRCGYDVAIDADVVVSGCLLADVGAVSQAGAVDVFYALEEQDVYYVALDGGNLPPYARWATAANSIQDALNAAGDGDLVMVSNGTYVVSAPLRVDSAVELRSLSGAEQTVIDADYSTRCVAMRCTNAVINGFTVQKGKLSAMYKTGAGINLTAPGVVKNCVVTSNLLNGFFCTGGGIYYAQGGVLTNTTVIANTTSDDGGAGICSESGVISIQNCTIVSNNTTGTGTGAGIYIKGGSALVSDTLIEGNYTPMNGGAGVYIMGSLIMDRCRVVGNEGHHYGGGMHFDISSSGTIRSSLIADNIVEKNGGGIYAGSSVPLQIKNCTIAGNSSGQEGGGAYLRGDCTLDNSILYHNTSPQYKEYITDSVFTNCYVDLQVWNSGQNYNLVRYVDPLFVDLTSGRYILAVNSPCIDVGTNRSWMASATDVYGASRIINGLVDIGSSEYNAETCDSDCDGLLDSFETAITGTSLTNINTDADAYTDYEEYVAGTSGSDSNDFFRITAVNNSSPCTVCFNSLAERNYTLLSCTNLAEGAWQPQTVPRAGVGGPDSITDSSGAGSKFFKIQVSLP